jgi:uncharacterized protein (DUF1697 family)
VPGYVALLRAVNVGGRSLKMAELRAALEGAGYPDAATHLQSGNVLLRASGRAADLESSVESVIASTFGIDVDVMARTAAQMRRIASEHPLGGRGVDPKTLAVGFLKEKPTPAAMREHGKGGIGPDEYVVRGTELYLRFPQGQGRSKMTAPWLQRRVGVPSTVRNWGVTTRLAELATELGR